MRENGSRREIGGAYSNFGSILIKWTSLYSIWYGHTLTGEMPRVFDQPVSANEMIEFARMAEIFDDRLLRACDLPDALVSMSPRDEAENRGKRARSTILSQAVHHANEHRAQLVSALEAGGYTTVNLDDFALWGYADIHPELLESN